MANKIQIKRGTNLSNAGTPAAGELIFDSANIKLYVGDGTTAATGLTAIGGVGTITSVTGMTNNNVLTASGSTTISGESDFTFNASTGLLKLNQDNSSTAFKVTGGGGGSKIAQFIRDVGVADPYAEVYIHAGGADPQLTFRSSANQYFSMGIDLSASSFKISEHTGVGTSDRFTIDTDGDFNFYGTNSNFESVLSGGATYYKMSGTATQRLEIRNTSTGAHGWIGIPSWNTDAWHEYMPTSSGNELAYIYEASRHNYYRGFTVNNGGDDYDFIVKGQNDDNLIRVDASADNVGIGATNPLRKLHVVGSMAVNEGTGQYYGILMGGGEGNDPKITIGDWHNSSGSIMWDSSANVLQIDSQHTTSARDIVFTGNDGATEYMRVNTTVNIPGSLTLGGTVDGRDVASDGSKLDGIESGATADQTAAQLLTAIKTVDGAGSGLDADTLDGLQLNSSLRNNEANTIVRTQSTGYAMFGWINTTSGNTTNASTDYYVNTNDGYIRKKTLALVRTEIMGVSSGSSFLRSDTGDTAAGNITFTGKLLGNSATTSILNGATVTNLNDGFTNDIGTGKAEGLQPFRYSNNTTNTPLGGGSSMANNANWGLSLYSHSSAGTGNYGLQMSGGDNDNQLFFIRRVTNGSFGNWFEMWHSGNDGTGSGLDADLLDGNHASAFLTTSGTAANSTLLGNLGKGSFLRSDATDTATGALTLSTQTWNGHITWNAGMNIYVAGESSFDVSGSGVWQVWDSGNGEPFIKCDVGQQVEIGDAGNRGVKIHGNSFINGQLQGGFGAQTTGGTTDWNHSTNARSGNGHTLLLSTHTNGPGTTTVNEPNNMYYHTLSFEYAGYDGDGNMAQIGIPYSMGTNPVRPVIRTRYGGTWSPYHSLVTANANGQIQAGMGTAALPSYTFNGGGTSDTNTGILRTAADTIGFSTGGSTRFTMNGSGVFYASSAIQAGNAGIQIWDGTHGFKTVLAKDSTYTKLLNNDGAVSLYLGDSGDGNNYYNSGGHRFRSMDGGTYFAAINSTGLRIGTGGSFASYKLDVVGNARFTADARCEGRFLSAPGTAAAPAYSFYSDGNTGMYRKADDSIGFSAGGTERMYMDSTKLFITGAGVNTFRIQFPNDQRIYDNGGGGLRVGAAAHALELYGGSSTDRITFINGGISGSETARITPTGLELANTKKLVLDGAGGNTYINQNSGSSSRLDFTVNGSGIMDLFNDNLRINGHILAGSNSDTNGVLAMAIRLAGDDLYNVWGSQYSSAKMMMGKCVKPKTGSEGFVSSADNAAHTREAVTMGSGLWQYYTAASATVAVGTDVTMTERVRFDASGNGHFDADVVAYSSTVSDERLKDNIQTIPNALDKVKALRGVEFDWNATSRKGKHDIGVIAQEVEEVLPEIVKEHTLCTGEFTDNEKEFKTVDYDKMIGVLIEAIKEQQVQIDELKTQIGE